MDIKEIKQIVDLMKRSGLTEFEIEQKDLKLRISRNSLSECAPVAYVQPSAALPVQQPEPTSQQIFISPSTQVEQDPPGVKIIKSPMVGTFYRAPSPESPAFVDLNTVVQVDTVVCIIEAMKVMNEIQSELSGTIIEILVENGQPVEYGQPLFKLKS